MSKKKKGMKKNEKIVILVLVIILIAVIIFAVTRNSSSEAEEKTATSSTTVSSETELETGGDYSVVLEDGTKLNTSTKLNETKTLGGLEITDIQLTESGNMTQLLATITNTSSSTEGGYTATLTLIDENGETLIELKPYIPELEAGESTQLNASSGLDYCNAYDFTITK